MSLKKQTKKKTIKNMMKLKYVKNDANLAPWDETLFKPLHTKFTKLFLAVNPAC